MSRDIVAEQPVAAPRHISFAQPWVLFWGVMLATSLVATLVEGLTLYGALYALFCLAMMGGFGLASKAGARGQGLLSLPLPILQAAALAVGILLLVGGVQIVSGLTLSGQKVDFLDKGSSVDLLSKIAAVAGNPFYYNNLGVRQLAEGNRAEARRAFQKATELKPDYALARYNLASLSVGTEADKQLQKALLLSPNNISVLKAMARRCVASGSERQLQARYYIGRLIETDPRLYEGYYLLGASLEKSNLDAKAAEAYEKALAALDGQQPPDPAERESVVRALNRVKGAKR